MSTSPGTAPLSPTTGLASACANGDMQEVKRWLSQHSSAGIEEKNNINRSPLSYAAHGGYLDILALLIDHKVKLKKPTLPFPPLTICVSEG